MIKDSRRALITGVTGQDGAYLSEHLLKLGYEVHGVKRRVSMLHTDRIDGLYGCDRFKLHYGDVTDSTSLVRIMMEVRPHEVYNLAAQSHVQVSFSEPEYTGNADALGCLRVLECVRALDLGSKVYQAGTSEMYGRVLETPQTERTPFNPVSPYGSAKVYACNLVRNYRESYGMFACTGILFNHESPLRGETFVTRKITRHVAAFSEGLTAEPLRLGNLNALRDWGHARDYVRAMHLMLQAGTPKDYVIATGEQHSVREFAEKSFRAAGVKVLWEGEGLLEVGRCSRTGSVLVEIDPRHFRPNEVETLLGDPSTAAAELGWRSDTSFDELVSEMVEADIECARTGRKFSRMPVL